MYCSVILYSTCIYIYIYEFKDNGIPDSTVIFNLSQNSESVFIHEYDGQMIMAFRCY